MTISGRTLVAESYQPLLEAVFPQVLRLLLCRWQPSLQLPDFNGHPAAYQPQRQQLLAHALDMLKSPLPLRVEEDLIRLREMATAQGHERLCDTLASSVDEQVLELDPANLAARALVFHGGLLEVAFDEHSRATQQTALPFVDFVPATDALPFLDFAEHQEELEQRLGRRLSTYISRARCSIRIEQSTEEVRFHVTRTGTVNAVLLFGDSLHVDKDGDHVEQHDLLVYEARSGRLAVHAQRRADQRTYACVFGELFWNDSEHFQLPRLFSAISLQMLGPASLVPGIHGPIEHAECVGATVRMNPRADVQYLKASPCTSDHLPLWPSIAQAWKVLSVRVWLQLRPHCDCAMLEVHSSGGLALSRWNCREVASAFLLRSGLVRADVQEAA